MKPALSSLAALVCSLALSCADTDFEWRTLVITPAEAAHFDSAGLPTGKNTSAGIDLPSGGGLYSGSTKVFSLGHGGSLLLRFEKKIINGPGVDFKIFENVIKKSADSYYTEVASIELSFDGSDWYPWPAAIDEAYPSDNPLRFSGYAGLQPVLSNSANPDSPLPEDDGSGGDFFDLEQMSMPIKETGFYYIRITDCGDSTEDAGNLFADGDATGFDLDSVVGINYE